MNKCPKCGNPVNSHAIRCDECYTKLFPKMDDQFFILTSTNNIDGYEIIVYKDIWIPIKWILILSWNILKWTLIVAAFIVVWLFVAVFNGIVSIVEKAANVGREDYPTDDNGVYEADRVDFNETKQNHG